MKKLTIDISDDHYKKLEIESVFKGVSISESIQDYLTDYLEKKDIVSFQSSTNKQSGRYYILIPKVIYQKITFLEKQMLNVKVRDLINNNEIQIVSKIIKQGTNHLIPIYSKNYSEFEKFFGKDLKIILEKI